MRVDFTALLLAHEVHDGLGSINGSSATNGDNRFGADLLVELDAFLDVSNRSMFANFPKRASVGVVFLENILDASDDIGLSRPSKSERARNKQYA